MTCLTALATIWWWTTATRSKTLATIKSPSAMLTELVLTLSSKISKKENKCYRALFWFDILHRDKEGAIHKVTFQRQPFERKWQNDNDAFELLGSSDDSEENNRSRGGAKLAPGPSVKAWHGRRPSN